MSKQIKVSVSIDDRTVTLEGPEEFVREEVARLTARTENPMRPLGSGRGTGEAAVPSLSEKEMIAQKRPKGHAETVAVLAMGLREGGLREFGPQDMHKAYIRAGVRPPKVMHQALRDAKNKYEFLETGASRATYRLSPHGERTVLFDLPRKRAGER
jgi:hypothetical protein